MSRINRLSLLALIMSACALPVFAVAGAALAPEVSVSLRGVANRTIEVGEPLFVAVRIEIPDESNAAIKLAPASGTWADGVEIEVTGPGGGVPALRARPTTPPDEPTATLDGDRIAAGVWTVASTATAQLVPGDYRVKARLVIHDGKGWTGDTASDEIILHVVTATAGAERLIQRNLALAREAALADAPEKAAGLIDGLLSSDPDNIRLLMARAALCLRGSDYRAAMTCVNRAMNRVERDGWQHPPVGLFELENQVAAGLMTSGAAHANPPGWTRLPASVLAPLQDERSLKTPSVQAATGVMIPAARVASGAVVPTVTAPANATEITNPPVAHPAIQSLGMVASATELTDAKITADPAGQWAVSAAAGTQYGKTQYSAAKATGAPSVPVVGNSPDAWCPANKTSGTDWLEVTFAKPVHATEVRVRQNDAAGAIAKIEAIEAEGTAHVWWEGVDPYVAPATRDIVWFAVRVPQTDYLVAKVKITLNLAAGPGWKEIDAVQLVGTPE